jgi:hypothetical protein
MRVASTWLRWITSGTSSRKSASIRAWFCDVGGTMRAE